MHVACLVVAHAHAKKTPVLSYEAPHARAKSYGTLTGTLPIAIEGDAVAVAVAVAVVVVVAAAAVAIAVDI